MNDSHGRSETTSPAAAGASPSARSRAVRPVLWVLLVIFAAGDMVLSRLDANVAVDAAFGLATMACATCLIVHHYRNRRG
ncbi:hypothetical protein [Actinomadura chibensis]|uniref:Uncharacterized protein n=1 Tax=Actinomadura chibensis TaxID=392828 RepID=A0A5D0NHZ2_9ACTN|nr:hypothetical protein [Actinomadura chibensis]TYB44056.1 hypothetical protein FXF69_24170 [Actinomadura chibensis]